MPLALSLRLIGITLELYFYEKLNIISYTIYNVTLLYYLRGILKTLPAFVGFHKIALSWSCTSTNFSNALPWNLLLSEESWSFQLGISSNRLLLICPLCARYHSLCNIANLPFLPSSLGEEDKSCLSGTFWTCAIDFSCTPSKWLYIEPGFWMEQISEEGLEKLYLRPRGIWLWCPS